MDFSTAASSTVVGPDELPLDEYIDSSTSSILLTILLRSTVGIPSRLQSTYYYGIDSNSIFSYNSLPSSITLYSVYYCLFFFFF